MSQFQDESIFCPGGDREMVDEARAKILLNELKSIESPSVVRLSNKSFSADAARLFAERIAHFGAVSFSS